MVGVVFKDEANYRELHDLWVFIVRVRERLFKPQQATRRQPRDMTIVYLARADRGALSDLRARVPRLAPLADKKIVVVGLGALGSMCAWQLARAGVQRLTLVDYDVVHVGNIPRWVVGWHAAGNYKADVLSQFLASQYPFLEARSFIYRLGNINVTAQQAHAVTRELFD